MGVKKKPLSQRWKSSEGSFFVGFVDLWTAAYRQTTPGVLQPEQPRRVFTKN
jgi:hypothetical protein